MKKTTRYLISISILINISLSAYIVKSHLDDRNQLKMEYENFVHSYYLMSAHLDFYLSTQPNNRESFTSFFLQTYQDFLEVQKRYPKLYANSSNELYQFTEILRGKLVHSFQNYTNNQLTDEELDVLQDGSDRLRIVKDRFLKEISQNIDQLTVNEIETKIREISEEELSGILGNSN